MSHILLISFEWLLYENAVPSSEKSVINVINMGKLMLRANQ